MKKIKKVSNGVIAIEGYLWVASDTWPDGLKESAVLNRVIYYKTKTKHK